MTHIKGIAPQFIVPDVVKAAEYYRDILGFTINSYFLDPPVFAMVERDGILIHFGKSDKGDFAPNAQFREIVSDAYIWVYDVMPLYEEFKTKNAEITEPPTMRVYGMREMKIKDCYGYTLVFGDGR